VLYLFDIDGTLLKGATVEHAIAIRTAIESVFGVELPANLGVEAAGRTDLEIARAVALLAGVEPASVDAGLARIPAIAAAEYARHVPDDLSATVAPGIRELLDELAARDGERLSLVTGNIEPIARLKLHAAGIADYFVAGQGGFGSDHEERTALPAIARARAGDGCEAYPRERTVVIGDTPLDIACARADGIRCVAVATGLYGIDHLTDADTVVADGYGLLAALDALA
jgi:phosphoglycolate phosphatase-like HAD superfamily hydrolase